MGGSSESLKRTELDWEVLSIGDYTVVVTEFIECVPEKVCEGGCYQCVKRISAYQVFKDASDINAVPLAKFEVEKDDSYAVDLTLRSVLSVL